MSGPPDSTERTVDLRTATLIGVGAIVGGGILALAGHAFAVAGPATLLVFAVNGVVALLTAMSFSELATRFPVAGGAYAFARQLLGVRAAFVVGWLSWFAYLVAGVLYALGFAVFAQELMDALLASVGWGTDLGGPWLTRLLAVLAIGGYTAQLSRKTAGGGQGATIGKVLVFGLLIVLGLARLPSLGSRAISDALLPLLDQGAGAIAVAMGLTFIALQGFDAIATVAGEVKDPTRTLPRAMFGSLGIALLIYLPLLFVTMVAGVEPGGSIAELAQADPETVMAEAARQYAGTAGWWLVVVAAVLAMLIALQANVLAASQVARSMARDRTLPRGLASSDPESGAPSGATAASGLAMVAILVIVADVESAGAAASLIFLLTFSLVHGVAWLARKRLGPDPAGFTAPWFPAPHVVGGLACVALAASQLLRNPAAAWVTLLWVGLGALLYRGLLAERAQAADVFAEANDPNLARARGRTPLVLVPVANPAKAPGLLGLADAIAPPRVGQLLLLTVAKPGDRVSLERSRDVLHEALLSSLHLPRQPEALTTFGDDPAARIVEVARQRRCQSLVLGLSQLEGGGTSSMLRALLNDAGADVVVLRAPTEFRVSSAQRILVPLGGRAAHDELRARLLGALQRTARRQVTFLTVLPAATPDDQVEAARSYLTRLAADEAPRGADVVVERSDDVVSTVAAQAAEADLVVLGMLRQGRHGRSVGEVPLEIVRRAGTAAVFIGRA